MYDIFISYSSADRQWAEILETKLIEMRLKVYRDKTRLAVAKPYQEQLFQALGDSRILVVIWSTRVQDMKGDWKEWVITEREYFRQSHQGSIIIYILLDDASPQVDEHFHKLDDLRGENSPGQADSTKWKNILSKIRETAFSDKIEIHSYVIACTHVEFDSLKEDPNLRAALENLQLDFTDVLTWYGHKREGWKPAGGKPITQTIHELETKLTKSLSSAGVPDLFRNKNIFVRMDSEDLWSPMDTQAQQEVERLCKVDYAWFFIDPLSLYHKDLLQVARRIGPCIRNNSRTNVFLINPTGHLRNRTTLREKLQLDFGEIYNLLFLPSFDSIPSYFGAIDAWHPHDFERVFRQTIRYYRENLPEPTASKSLKSGFTNFTLNK